MHEPLLVSFLQDAAEQIYSQYGDDLLYKVSDEFLTTPEKRFYEIPEKADPFSITDMVLSQNGETFHHIKHGIDNKIRTKGEADPVRIRMPNRWDIAAGDMIEDAGRIELWPVPDKEYTIRLSYYPAFGEKGWGVIDTEPYIDLDDPCPIYPSRLVLLLALGNAKSHFGMQDAQAAYKQFEQYLSKHKASLLAGVRFKRGFQYGVHIDDDATGGRTIVGDDIIVDLTPPDSITGELSDTILPEASTEKGPY